MYQYYTIASTITESDYHRLGVHKVDGALFLNDRLIEVPTSLDDCKNNRLQIVARLTGENRVPLEGEWRLEGSVPHAYVTTDGYQTFYQIVKLVIVRSIMVFAEI